MRFYKLLLLFSTVLVAQTEYPKDYFGVPVDIPILLSGNFAELRPNHFHAGFDIKTKGREGIEVHSVADGFVSRIKISPYGNGSALYIDHPNGFTSVYCHLQQAQGPIADFIRKAQYKENSFEVELFLKPTDLPVKKGELIALTGNTGSSQGPHLHFEFRDTKTEKIINPLHFGYDSFLKDTRKPTVAALYVYPLDDKTTVNNSKRPILLNLALQKDGTYLANKVSANGKIGFGVTAEDYDAASYSKNGIYKIQSHLNGKATFGFQMDTYSFDEMRYINALIDYPKYRKTGQRVQKLFMETPFPLSIITTDADNGVVTVKPNLSSVYQIDVADYFGNTTTITVPISYDMMSTIIEKEVVESNYFVKVNRENIFSKDNWTVTFPAGTFYDNFDMNFNVRGESLYLHDEMTPVHSSFTISVENEKYGADDSGKVYIADVDSRGRYGYNYTTKKGNVFTTKVKSLGRYTLAKDTSNPTISIGRSIEGKWISSQKSIDLTIGDSGSGIKSYNGYLNGVWALFEYDYKTRKITHNFSEGIVAEGANELKVVVVDNVGNSTTFETRFFRSQK
ncbi:peptidase M23 [Flavobacterium faecale]|uniref:Peptidase M23 n=1 Tax=Flavobacterium faecale TaxID=1355330 RepID=A0A2S1LDN3_9FLAO|nr:M23 family metallopeptidase [Flavobacterium faecale]AWG21636.1 peptidase M23 [Flavobacterium faecale]